jgi:rRNA maturation endonuclease Nob1
MKTGRCGWPLVANDASYMFPDEEHLECPKCGSGQVIMTVQHGPGGEIR